jgi:hypothetical protein
MQKHECESSTQCVGSCLRFAEQSVLKNCWKKVLAFCFGTLISIAPAIGQEVTVAGFSFAGDFKSAQSRFPYTYKLFSQAKSSGKANFSALITERVRTVRNERLQINAAENLVSLKKSDRALMTTLVLTDEVVSTENFGAYYKTFVNLRGSALVFDYKNQLIVASYPISVVLFDATPERPTERRIAEFVDNLIRREDGRGLISQYVRRLETASIPENGSKTLQVKKGSVAPDALAYFPESLRSNPALVESMLADAFGAVLSSKLKVSMLPTSIGHAIGGVMSMRLENGDDFKLKVGEGDYLFDLKLNRLAKIKTSENNVGTGYVYGAYMSVRFFEPALDTTFFASDLKNGESAVVPIGQIAGDDFAAYQDAIRGLYIKLADAFVNPDSAWIKAAAGKNVDEQLDVVRKTLRNFQ